MKVAGRHYRSLWVDERGEAVEVIDQTRLPHQFVICRISDRPEMEDAIRRMVVRGAPLIGAAGAYGLALAMAQDPSDRHLSESYDSLLATRPTAVNLRWALDDLAKRLRRVTPSERRALAFQRAGEICEEDVEINRQIGLQGCERLYQHWRRCAADPARPRGAPLNILTHCNAGWLATIDWGTALAPIYQAHDTGLPLHVWVDETRPRNQGAALTAWELKAHGIPHTVIADNAGGHLMQRGQVDLCIVGTDRTTSQGDVCNKIGTYLKALAARAHGIPFYVALPSPTIDWDLERGQDIPIEERSTREVSHILGRDAAGEMREVQLVPEGTQCANPAFDVTPAQLITGLITERGIAQASKPGLLELFPERRAVS